MTTIKRYTFIAAPPYGRPGQTGTISKAALQGAIPDARVRHVILRQDGTHHVELDLERPSHPDAMTEIEGAVARFLLDFAEAQITELVTNELAGAFIGGGGGAAGGAAATKDPAATIVTGLLGSLGGAIVGSFVETVVARYQARRDHYRGWVVSRVDQPTPPETAR
jgi:hypothetical protein